MYEIRDAETDKVIKSGIKTDAHLAAAMVRMARTDIFGCTVGGKSLVGWMDDNRAFRRATLLD